LDHGAAPLSAGWDGIARGEGAAPA